MHAVAWPSGCVIRHINEAKSLVPSVWQEMSTVQGQWQCSAAGKKTVIFILHWPCVIVSQTFWLIHLWVHLPKAGRWAPRLHSSEEHGSLYLLTKTLCSCRCRSNQMMMIPWKLLAKSVISSTITTNLWLSRLLLYSESILMVVLGYFNIVLLHSELKKKN